MQARNTVINKHNTSTGWSTQLKYTVFKQKQTLAVGLIFFASRDVTVMSQNVLSQQARSSQPAPSVDA